MSVEAALEALGAIVENAARHASATVEVLAGSDGKGRWIEVNDDGPGIPLHLHSAVLERGVRLDERGQNHGLGLSIAREIVEASGGELSLRSNASGGLSVLLKWNE